jgi:hypothetical protein
MVKILQLKKISDKVYNSSKCFDNSDDNYYYKSLWAHSAFCESKNCKNTMCNLLKIILKHHANCKTKNCILCKNFRNLHSGTFYDTVLKYKDCKINDNIENFIKKKNNINQVRELHNICQKQFRDNLNTRYKKLRLILNFILGEKIFNSLNRITKLDILLISYGLIMKESIKNIIKNTIDNREIRNKDRFIKDKSIESKGFYNSNSRFSMLRMYQKEYISKISSILMLKKMSEKKILDHLIINLKKLK